MRINDIHVEVRGRDLDGSGGLLDRQGVILPRDLNLKATTRWSGVGEWELTLPGGHPMVPYLMRPGSGIVVTGPIDQTLHPTEFSEWEETGRNRFINPSFESALEVPVGAELSTDWSASGSQSIYVPPILTGYGRGPYGHGTYGHGPE